MSFLADIGKKLADMARKILDSRKPKAVTLRDKISVDRVNQLHPKVRDTFGAFIVECEQTLDITLRVVQGLRSFETQQALFDQPRDGKDNDGDGRVDESDEKVTSARPGASFHQYGMAVDLVQMKAGKPDWNGTPYKKIAEVAKKYGIGWGGAWNDKPHFQKTLGYSWRQLLDKYQRKDFIPGTRYVNI
jgi:peptidoglycan L-alanyl-D-glutamate endopeptidase CwlK